MLSKSPEQRYHCGRGIVIDLLHCKRVINQASILDEKNTIKQSGEVVKLQEEERVFVPGKYDVSDVFIIPPKLYGRENDLKTLSEAYEKACASSKSQLIMVTGYAGTDAINLQAIQIHSPLTTYGRCREDKLD